VHGFVRKHRRACTTFPGNVMADAPSRVIFATMRPDQRALTTLRTELDSLRRRLVEREPRFESHSMDLLRVLLANAPGFISMLSLDGTILFSNRVREGGTLDEAVGICVYDFLPPSQRDALRTCIDEVVRTGAPGSCESEAILRTGRAACFESQVAPIKDDDEVVALVFISTDITARKRVHRALRRSEEKLRVAVDAAGIGLWSWEPRTDHVAWEDALCALFGLEPGRAPEGRDEYLALVHPEDRQEVRDVVARGVAAGGWESEYRILRADGAVRWVMEKGTAIRGQGEEADIVFGAIIDVTERRLRDDQLRQAQKLEAVGQLTAGIAHNFNNLLMTVIPNLELAMKQAPPAISAILSEAQHASLRAAELVRQLTTYAGRNRPAERRVEALGPLVARAVGVCRTTFDRRITFEVGSDADACARVDPAQLEQVFLNLLINARDALAYAEHHAPRVTVDVNVVGAGARELAPAAARGVDHVRIMVRDNGIGMDAATLDRIYEPFFTTKSVGQGTGLGLATTHAIIREHGGWIACESTPHVGTIFSVYLPRAAPVAWVEPLAPEPVPRGGGETVLVIDDEPGIRNVVSLVLESAGYTAKRAASGQDALDLLTQTGTASSISLILLDVSMPGRPAHELRKRLRELVPRARIVYFTGHAFEATDADDIVLEKPVTEARLLRTVREALDNAS
jgi:two-component system cell cycle sensor histidine kinase/response regulator CckA